MRTKLLGLAVALCLLTGCNIPVVGPEPPALPDVAGVGFTLQPPVLGIKFVLGLTECVSDERGVAWCPNVKAADYFLKLDLPEEFVPDAGGIYSINKSSCKNVDGEPSWPNCEIKITLDRVKPVIAPAVGRVVTNGEMFSLSGSPWQWRGSTDFMLFRDYLNGKDISEVLTQRREAGANIIRVLGMAHYIPVNAGQPAFNVSNYPQYFDKLRTFVDYVATFGLRVEFTALADGQLLMPDAAQQDAFLARVVGALPETAFLEICNECWKNGVDPAARWKNLPRTALVVATGDYTFEKPIVAEYVTVHESRDAEWPRKSRLDEWYANVHMPVVWDEPIGADETNQPDRRSNVVEDFYDLCAGAALHGAGLTFHSTSGLLSQMWRDHEGRAAVACFDAMRAVPVETPLWDYTRGGLGNNPIAHDDAIALRTWCQMTGSKAVCEVVRPSPAWVAEAVNGWRIVKQDGPNGRLIFLER
jgi:hypothetical protein